MKEKDLINAKFYNKIHHIELQNKFQSTSSVKDSNRLYLEFKNHDIWKSINNKENENDNIDKNLIEAESITVKNNNDNLMKNGIKRDYLKTLNDGKENNLNKELFEKMVKNNSKLGCGICGYGKKIFY